MLCFPGRRIGVFLLAVCPLMAQILVEAQSLPIHPHSFGERLGRLSFTLTQNPFGQPSYRKPVYLRLQLPEKVFLAQSLVDGLEDDAPIQLALSSNTREAVNLVADPNSIEIVRWKKGEDAIWMRIRTYPGTWFQDEKGNDLGPSSTRPVRFALGQTQAESKSSNQTAFDSGLANLTQNTQSKDPVHTVVLVDTWFSKLGSDVNTHRFIEWVPSLWDDTTEGVVEGDSIVLGQSLAFSTQGVRVVGEGQTRDRNLRYLTHIPTPTSRFSGQMTLLNTSAEERAISLVSLDDDGSILDYQALLVEPNVLWGLDPLSLFAEQPNHVVIFNGTAIEKGLLLTPKQGQAPPTFFQAEKGLAKQFTVLPINDESFFDVLVAVNTSNKAAHLTLNWIDETGQNLGQKVVEEPIEAWGRWMVDPMSLGWQFMGGDRLEVQADQTLAFNWYRGNEPGMFVDTLMALPVFRVADAVDPTPPNPIADPQLRQLLLDQLDRNHNAILDPEETATVKELWLNDAHLVSLAGIEQFRQLERLYADNNQLVSLPDLATACPNLQVVTLTQNPLRSLSALKNNRQLKTLIADHNAIDGLLDASNWSDLRVLSISDNRISRVEGLAECSQLTYINLSLNNLSAVPDLSPQATLEALFLDRNQFGSDACPALQALQRMAIDYVGWNPQNDGSELMCEVRP